MGERGTRRRRGIPRRDAQALLLLAFVSGVRCRCMSYSVRLESSGVNPCSTFEIDGFGCFADNTQRDVVVESFRWIVYERYTQIFKDLRTSNAYGGKCSGLYEKTCPGHVNTISDCEPLCKWFKNVVTQEAKQASCKCDKGMRRSTGRSAYA